VAQIFSVHIRIHITLINAHNIRQASKRVGTDHAVYRKYSDDVTCNSWQNIAGFYIASPAAVSPVGNQIDLFVVGGDNAIYRRRFV
jgi:hypothetical protein